MSALLEPAQRARIERDHGKQAEAKGKKQDIGHMRLQKLRGFEQCACSGSGIDWEMPPRA